MLRFTGLGKDGVEGWGTDVSIVLVFLGMGVSALQQGVLMCSSRSERLALHAKVAYASHEVFTRP